MFSRLERTPPMYPGQKVDTSPKVKGQPHCPTNADAEMLGQSAAPSLPTPLSRRRGAAAAAEPQKLQS